MNKITLLTVVACGVAIGYAIADRGTFSFTRQKTRAIAQRFDEICLAGLKSRATTDYRQIERTDLSPIRVSLNSTLWADPTTGGYFVFDERRCLLEFWGPNAPRQGIEARYLSQFVEARLSELSPEIKRDPKATLGPNAFLAAWTNWEIAPVGRDRWGASIYIVGHDAETASASLYLTLSRL